MTTLVFAGSLLAAQPALVGRAHALLLLLMLAESAVLGAFLAQDLALFVASST